MDLVAVVDDDGSLRSATIDLLNSAGFTCAAYASAEDYLGSGRLAEARCIILDLRMPGLSGLDLQQRLGELGQRSPIIFLTAYPEERTRRQAMSGGAVCYLAKPYTDSELLDCVHRALASR